MTQPATTTYVDDGSGWTGIYGGLVDAVLEYVPALTFPQSVRTYARMRHSPPIRKVLSAYTRPITRTPWAVDGEGCRPEVTRQLADDLGLPVKGQDAPPSGARRRGVDWSDHLRVAVGDLTFGFQPFEAQYDRTSGRARLVALAERMPQTIADIKLAADGSIAQVTQTATAGQKADPVIPASSLVWYVHDREGSNWTGTSLIRPAYGPWLLGDEMRRVLATSSRRFGMGVPTVEAPPNATPAQVAEAQRLASSIRVGDQSGAGLPAGFKYALAGLTGSVPDTLAFIKYLDHTIADACGTELFELGNTDSGSRALGDVFLETWLGRVQSIADTHAAQATRQIAVPYVDANWGENEPVPRIVVGDVAASSEITDESLQLLLASGAITADPALEEWIRKRRNLPTRSIPWVPPAVKVGTPHTEAPAEPVKAAAGDADPKARWRDLTPFEAAAGTRPDNLDEQHHAAAAAVLAAVVAAAAALVVAAVDAVRRALAGRSLTDLADITLERGVVVETLTGQLTVVWEAAAAEQVQEAARQGVTIDPAPVDTARVADLAELFGEMVTDRVEATARGEAARNWTPDDEQHVVDAVEEALHDLVELTPEEASAWDDIVTGAVQATTNSARLDTVTGSGDVPGDDYKLAASEVLDKNTCDPCRAIDGHVYDTILDAQLAYATGGYAGCKGRLRCRGILVTKWRD